MVLASSVPSAAPAAPIAGTPKSPKIKIALKIILASRDVPYTTVAITTFSTLRIIFRYTLVNADSI